jgi:hypothetical protein
MGRSAEAESRHVKARALFRKHFGEDDERIQPVRQARDALRGAPDRALPYFTSSIGRTSVKPAASIRYR